MKGLIAKDWYIVRTQLILSFCIFLLPNIFLLLYFGGFDPAQEMTDGLMPTLMSGMVSVFSILGCSSFMINTVNEDVTSGWTEYALTAPVSKRKLCAAKIINSIILTAVLSAVSFSVSLFAAEKCGIREIMTAVPVCAAFLQIAAISPVFPLAIRFGARKASAFYIFFLILAVGILAAACILLLNSEHIMRLRWVFYGGIPAIAAISVGLSLGFGKKSCVN